MTWQLSARREPAPPRVAVVTVIAWIGVMAHAAMGQVVLNEITYDPAAIGHRRADTRCHPAGAAVSRTATGPARVVGADRKCRLCPGRFLPSVPNPGTSRVVYTGKTSDRFNR